MRQIKHKGSTFQPRSSEYAPLAKIKESDRRLVDCQTRSKQPRVLQKTLVFCDGILKISET